MNVMQNARLIEQIIKSRNGLFIDDPGQIESSFRVEVNAIGNLDMAQRSKFRGMVCLHAVTLFSGAFRLYTNILSLKSISVENFNVDRFTSSWLRRMMI